MEVEGKVTEINEHLLYFVMDHCRIVYMAVIMVDDPHINFPKKNSVVKVVCTHRVPNHRNIHNLMLCKDSSIGGHFTPSQLLTYRKNREPPAQENAKPFYHLFLTCHMGVPDLYTIDRNMEALRVHFGRCEFTHQQLMVHVCQKLAKQGSQPDDRCVSQALGGFGLKMVGQFAYVDSCPKKYRNFTHWTFGVHRKGEKDYLFGHLMVNRYGTTELTDYKVAMPCVVSNRSGLDLTHLLDKFVLVKNYTLLTEVYNSQDFYSVQYLLFDAEDVIALDLCPANGQKLMVSSPAEKFTNSFTITIIHKALPTVSPKTLPEFWFGVALGTDSPLPTKKVKNMYICLEAGFSQVYPLLKEGHEYKIYYNEPFKKIFHKDLQKLSPTWPIYKVEYGNAIFVPSPDNQRKWKIDQSALMDARKAKENLTTGRTLASFVGEIAVKKFVPATSSRTLSYSSDKEVGTQGNKTHLLEINVEGQHPITVYLNNFENMATPRCLVPNMRIAVRNVLPQSSRYYKSTALTTFEVLDYVPLVPFETADLWDGETGPNWGPHPVTLGHGRALPVGVVVWGEICSFFVLGLKIRRQCRACNVPFEWGAPVCSRCRGNKHDLKVKLTLITKDAQESKVLAADGGAMLLLKVLLRAQVITFEKWLGGLRRLGDFEFSKGQLSQLTVDGEDQELQMLRQALTLYFTILNETGMQLQLKCRKIDKDHTTGNPVYYLLDARRAEGH